jgi:hypothetical protein
MGDDDPRLRRHWLHGLSPEVKARIDGRLICDHQILESRLRAAFYLELPHPRLPLLAQTGD